MPPKHVARLRRHRLALVGLVTAALVTATVLTILARPPLSSGADEAVVAAHLERGRDSDERAVAELSALDAESGAMGRTDSDSRAEMEVGSTLVLRARVARGALPDATVRVFEGDVVVGTPGENRTDRRGRARFRVPPDADVTVEVTHERLEEPIRKDARTAPSGASKTLVVPLCALVAPAPVELRVVTDRSGEPIAAATVEVLGPLTDKGREVYAEVETDEDGRVEVPWHEAGKVVANAPGHSRRSLEMRAGPADLELRLHAHAWISGTLSDVQRVEPGGAELELRIGLGRLPNSRNTSRPIRVKDIDEVDRHDAAREALRVTTGLPWFDANGRWLIGPIKFTKPAPDAKKYDVVVEVDGVARAIVKDIVVEPGDELVVEDHFTDAAPLDLQLRYDGDFDPPGAWGVFLGPEDSGRWGVSVMTTSTDEGRVQLDTLPKGRWDVYLKPEHRSNPLEHLATFEHRGEPDCLAVMRDHVPLKGVLMGVPRGSDVYVIASTADGSRHVECDASGAFDLSPVRRGAALTLTFNPSAYLGSSEEVVEVDGKLVIDRAGSPTIGPLRYEIVADGTELTLGER